MTSAARRAGPAGILPPGNLDAATTPESRLRALSHALWPDWAESLAAETGIETGYTRCGGLELRTASGAGADEGLDQLSNEVESWRGEGVRVETLSLDALREFEPLVAPEIAGAYRLPDLGQVRESAPDQSAAGGLRLSRRSPAAGNAGRRARRLGSARLRSTR